MGNGYGQSLGTPLPRAGFDALATERAAFESQLTAKYGIDGNAETFTATGGTVTAADNVFHLQSGTSIGGFGVLRTRRPGNVGPTQRMVAKIDAGFNPGGGAPLGLQLAGPFNVTNGYFVGYNGDQFGVMHRSAGGKMHATTMAIVSAGSGNVTLTLDDVDYGPIPITSTTNAENATEIAEWLTANQDAWRATQNGDTVQLLFRGAGPHTGTYAATGASISVTFTTYQLGVANAENWTYTFDDEFYATGTADSYQPQNLNKFRFEVGGGVVNSHVDIFNPSLGRFVRMYTWQHANAGRTPPLLNGTMNLGWVSASLGSTTNFDVVGTSASISVEGGSKSEDIPGEFSSTKTVGTSEVVMLAIRNRYLYGGTHNLRQIFPTLVYLYNGGANAEVILRAYLNPTFDTGAARADWFDADLARSVAELDVSAGNVSGGIEVINRPVGPDSIGALDFSTISLLGNPQFQLQPGDVLVFTAQKGAGGSASTVSTSITWQET